MINSKRRFLGVILTLVFTFVFAGQSYASYYITSSLISKSTAGVIGNNFSRNSDISNDGRYIVFESASTNLTSDAASGVFLRDTQAGTTTMASVDSSGVSGNGFSSRPRISGDGRYIVFQSDATNLVAGDTNDETDVFLHDTQTGITTRVSVSSAGVEGNGAAGIPAISYDGRYIAFSSDSNNLVASDTNSRQDIFLHDTQTGITTRVSVSSAGVEATNNSDYSEISLDGRYITFQSGANNLVSGDTNGLSYDVFLHDTQTATTTRVSLSTAGAQPNDEVFGRGISSDGRYVVLTSGATNLVTGDTNGQSDVFIRDTQTDTTTRVSVSSTGVQGNRGVSYARITSDGRYVFFDSYSSNLVSGDTNGFNGSDVFMRDTQTNTTTRISVGPSGQQGQDTKVSYIDAISPDGKYVSFTSEATNFISGDTNNQSDVFLITTPVPVVTTSSASVTQTTALINGSITTAYEPNTMRGFEYGLTSSYGELLAGQSGLFSNDLGYLLKFGSSGSGDGELSSPYNIAIDGSGNIYVSDTNNHRIQKFDPTGAYLSQFGSYGTGNGEFDAPQGIAIDSSGNIYVTDTNNHRIQKFDPTGAYLSQFGTSGSGDGEFSFPTSLAFDDSGNIYVSDNGNNRIQKFDPTGIYLSQFGSYGAGNGEFDAPYNIAIDVFGNMYVSDPNNQRIQKFDPTGIYLSQFGRRGAGNGEFSYPYGITLDNLGNIFVTDNGNSRIQKFAKSGSFTTTLSSLTCGTQYHYRSYSTNSNGTGYGDDAVFTTSDCDTTPEPTTVQSSSGGSSLGSRINNLVNMGKTKEAQDLANQFPNLVKPTIPVLNTLIKQGKKNSIEQVMTLQKILGLKDDGKFGPKTTKSVKEFQKKNGLKVDGIVGPKTWAIINSLKK